MRLLPHRCGARVKPCPSPLPAMELVLGTNFDEELLHAVAGFPVRTYFAGFPVSLTGAGRPPYILPDVPPERFRAHVAAIHRQGREFFATLNSADLGLKEYGRGFRDAFLREVDRLLDLGVDGFVVALPALIEAIHAAHPKVPISVSSFARVRSVAQAEYFLRLGADTIILEEGNRNFELIRGLVRAGARVEVLTNQTCIRECPYRAHHLNTSSLCSQPGGDRLWFEYPILECGLEVVRNPRQLISSIWIRPEDLAMYEEVGVHRFKVSGRNRSTEWLARAARAYAERSYHGNLLDILSFVQIKGPTAALAELGDRGVAPEVVGPLRSAFGLMDDVVIDNDAFPPDFMRSIATRRCESLSCDACGYCGRVAERAVRIQGKPPSRYRAPSGLPPSAELIEAFGRSARPDAST